MSEGTVHKRLKFIAMTWLKSKVTDITCIEAKFRNIRSIADACGINLKRKEVRIVEVKASKKDYDRDKKLLELDKSYYMHCQYFYIMCPKEILQLSDVPKEYGLLWVDMDTDEVIVKRSPKKYTDKTKTKFETSLKNICRAETNNYLFKYIIPTHNIKTK